MFKGVIGVTPTVVEYWLATIKRIINYLDYTLGQKLKGAISLLHEKGYQWWLTIKENTQPEQVNWAYFQNAFQNKHVGASYIKTRRREFMGLT